MIRALVLTHGQIGPELVRVAELIMGPVPGLAALSNQGKSAAQMIQEVSAWLTEGEGGEQADPAILLVDDYGGSCANAAQAASAGRAGAIIVCGVNLAMLLGFAAWRDDNDLEELATLLIKKGRDAITQVGNQP